MEPRFLDMAAALYDGGWRSSDRDELIAEYDLIPYEATCICKCLASYEAFE